MYSNYLSVKKPYNHFLVVMQTILDNITKKSMPYVIKVTK